MHYQRRHLKAENPITLTTEQRFLLKVAVNKETRCWEWTAHLMPDGYGRFQYGPKDGQIRVRAHRWSYEHWIGPIPDGMLVCHRCDNPVCVFPDHLFVGTSSENKQDEIRKGRNNPPRGTRNPRAVLSESLVQQIRSMYVPRRMSYRKIARELGVSEPAVKNVVQGITWRHVPKK